MSFLINVWLWQLRSNECASSVNRRNILSYRKLRSLNQEIKVAEWPVASVGYFDLCMRSEHKVVENHPTFYQTPL